MVSSFASLAVIAGVAFIGPFIAYLIPGRWAQSAAVILLLGAVLGPHMVGLIDPTAPGMTFLRQIGLAFLFLMGGYELDPKAVLGKTGRHAQASWLASFALALLVTWLLPFDLTVRGTVALAISLTTTTYGKVNAVLKASKIKSTRLGSVAISYGATGELLPVVAIALLLSDDAPFAEVAAIAGFALAAVVVVKVWKWLEKIDSPLAVYLRQSEEAQQSMERFIVAILVALVALGAALGTDMIVAGFAAGFIMRELVPPEDSEIVARIQGLATGFFIPCVYVLSGAAVSIPDGLREPGAVLAFIALLVVVRAGPVFAALRLDPATRDLTPREDAAVATLSCMAMSTVVAMTSVAVEAGDMSAHMASALVFAAALTTIVVPIVEHLLVKKRT
jgi:Kef-type K+ transport system membrane component KefB